MPKKDARYLAAYAFESSRGTTTYETIVWEDGTVSCNCPGWTVLRKGQPRACKHTRMVSAHVKELQEGKNPVIDGSFPLRPQQRRPQPPRGVSYAAPLFAPAPSPSLLSRGRKIRLDDD